MTEQGGYSPKELHFDLEAQQKLVSGITKIAKAVKSTLGPRGNTVLIESPNHTHGLTVTKDGVTVAKSISLIDPVENLAVRMMKEAADKTATLAGDGTTSSIVLTEALVLSGIELIDSSVNKTEVLKELYNVTKEVVGSLKKMSKPVSKKKLFDVATISANNDPTIGKIIADAYNKVGKNGIVTIEKSQTSDTYSTTTDGLKIDRGYTSPLFINDHKKDECVLNDVYVLVSDAEINNLLSIEGVLKQVIAENNKLLIVAPCSTNVVNTLAANVMKNNLKICNITPPSFGYKQHELMQDIALSVGATYFSEKTGDDLSVISFADLGHADKIIVGKDKTVVVRSANDNNADKVEQRVAQLWQAHENAKKKSDKDFILSRIASLTGGIGVIYVGGGTDLEQKELYDRVDDSVHAVRSALLEGILPGGGLALYLQESFLNFLRASAVSKERSVAIEMLSSALKSPLTQILSNAGLKVEQKYSNEMLMENKGYDLKGDRVGDMIAMGVIDPMKVTKTALQSAVSVATTILSTNAIVTMARAYEAQN